MNAYRFSDLKLGMTEEFCTAAVRGGGAVVRNTETTACGHAGRQGNTRWKSPGRAWICSGI